MSHQGYRFFRKIRTGKIFFIDTEEGRIVDDREIKETISGQKPYGKWLKENMVALDALPGKKSKATPKAKSGGFDHITTFKAFGYTREDLKHIIMPMVQNGQEPIGSMGNDPCMQFYLHGCSFYIRISNSYSPKSRIRLLIRYEKN